MEENLLHCTELVRKMIDALVDQPAEVVVQAISQQDGITFDVRVAPSDLGKIIGKQGRTARSLRTILMGIGVKNGIRMGLNIAQ